MRKPIKAFTPPNQVKGYNLEPDGNASTIKAVYYKTSVANFIRNDSFGATAAIEITETL